MKYLLIALFFFGCKTSGIKNPILNTHNTPKKVRSIQKSGGHDFKMSADKTPVKVPNFSSLKVKLYLKDKEQYRGGYLGNIGSKKIFYASKDAIPGYERLYWVMVSVLSEKFGCFMASRFTHKNQMLFKCRDGRMVNFIRKQSNQWVLFGVRQYDKYGREIVVRNSRIIGVGQRLKIPRDIWTSL